MPLFRLMKLLQPKQRPLKRFIPLVHLFPYRYVFFSCSQTPARHPTGPTKGATADLNLASGSPFRHCLIAVDDCALGNDGLVFLSAL